MTLRQDRRLSLAAISPLSTQHLRNLPHLHNTPRTATSAATAICSATSTAGALPINYLVFPTPPSREATSVADIPMDAAAPVDAHGEPPPTDSEQLPTADVVKKWTRKDLLDFTLIKNILEDPEDVTTFTHAKIDGDKFLAEGDRPDFWRVACGMAAGPSSQLSRLVSSIKGPGNAFHLASDEPANTFTVQSPASISIVPREAKRIAEEAEWIAEEAEWIAEEAERDEFIKSENSRAVSDPKSIAN